MNKAQLELNNQLIVAAKAGDAAELRRLLDAGASALARSCSASALSLACRAGSLDCARLLLARDANVNSGIDYLSPLMSACIIGNLELVRYLLDEAGADPLRMTLEDETPLYFAAAHGTPELADLLLARGVDINRVAADGTAFGNACRNGNVRMAGHLLSRGADPLLGERSLRDACKGGSLQLVQLVLDAGRKAGLKDLREVDRGNPMEYAVIWADEFKPEIARLMYDLGYRFGGMLGDLGWWDGNKKRQTEQKRLWLLEHGAFEVQPEPPVLPNKDFSAVVKAATQGADALRRLIDAGLDVNERDGSGYSALFLACWRGNKKAILTLLEAGADASVAACNGWRNTLTASRRLPASCIVPLCRHGADPNFRFEGYLPVIYWYLDQEMEGHALELLKVGIDPELRGCFGATPIMEACSDGMFMAAEKMLELGFDMEAFDSEEMTALMKAAHYDRPAIARWLLDHGANANTVNRFGETALMLGRTTRVATLLLDRGARADLVASHGYTALYSYFNPDVLQRLLDSGCPLNTHAEQTRDAMYRLMSSGANARVIRFFLDHGVKPDYADGGSPLVPAAQFWRMESAAMLLQAGANPNACSPGALLDTPLHRACMFYQVNPEFGYEPVVHDPAFLRMLLDAGADPNSRNEWLRTPLMEMCIRKKDKPEIARILLEYGADPALEDLDGLSALDFAERNGLEKMTKLLRGKIKTMKTKP